MSSSSASPSRLAAWLGAFTVAVFVSVVFSTVTVAAAPVDVGADTGGFVDSADALPTEDGDAAETEAGPSADTLKVHIVALRALLFGTPSLVRVQSFLAVDPLDDAAVEGRRVALRAKLALTADAGVDAASEAGEDADAAGATDAAVLPNDAGLLQVIRDRLELSFLSLSHAERAAALAAEETRAKEAERIAAAKAASEQAIAAEHRAAAAKEKALAEAEAEQDLRRKAVAHEKARAADVLASIATYRRQLTDRRAAFDSNARDRSAEVSALVEESKACADGAKADAVYDRLVLAVDRANDDFAAALDGFGSVAKAPHFEPDEAVLAAGPDAADVAEVRALAATSALEAKQLDADAAALALAEVASAFSEDRKLNGARLALIGRLSPGKRGRVLGIGADGFRALGREVRHIRLLVRWGVLFGVARARGGIASLRDPLVLAAVAWRLFLGLLLIVALAAGRRRGRGFVEGLEVIASQSLRRSFLLLPVRRLLLVTAALSAELLTLAGVLIIPWLIGEPTGALAAVYRVVLIYSWYRLIVVAAHGFIAYAASSPSGQLTEATSEKTLRTLRVVGRYLLVTLIVLSLAEAALGRGFMFHLVARFAWLGAVPIAVVLIRAWRGDIADAYLARRTHGALAERVARTRDRWYGFFVAAAAVAVLFASFIARTARNFVFGFERSRRALAYLFRRRLERQADEAGEVPDPSRLPAIVRKAFTADAAATVEREPGFEAVLRACDTVKSGRLSSLLVVGRTGFGKSTWLRAAREKLGEAVTLTLVDRVGTEEFVRRVSRACRLPETAVEEELISGLCSSTFRVVVLDDAQGLFGRGVSGLDAWLALERLVHRTAGKVLFVVGVAHYPYQWLSFVQRGTSFTEIVQISPWSEQEIGVLIDKRMASTGYEVIYDDLVVDAAGSDDAQAQIVSTKAEYIRLLWDHAEGSPRVALDAWRRSLVPDEGKRLRVRLFARPDSRRLDALLETEKFVLASVLWHESITIPECAYALGYSEESCGAALKRMRAAGIVEAVEDRYRVTVEWWSAVVRYLRRKHLIET